MAEDAMPDVFEYKLVLPDDEPFRLTADETKYNPTDVTVKLWLKKPNGRWAKTVLPPDADDESRVSVPTPLDFGRDPHVTVSYDIMDRPGGSDEYCAECEFSGGPGGLRLEARDPSDARVRRTIRDNALRIQGRFSGQQWKRVLARVQLVEGQTP